jgi:hypothetical protein
VAASSLVCDGIEEAKGDRDVVSQAIHLLFYPFALMDVRSDLMESCLAELDASSLA